MAWDARGVNCYNCKKTKKYKTYMGYSLSITLRKGLSNASRKTNQVHSTSL